MGAEPKDCKLSPLAPPILAEPGKGNTDASKNMATPGTQTGNSTGSSQNQFSVTYHMTPTTVVVPHNPGEPVTGDTHYSSAYMAFSVTETMSLHCEPRGIYSAGNRKQKLVL